MRVRSLAEEGQPGPNEAQEFDKVPQQYRDIGRSNNINEQTVSFHVCQVERLMNDRVVENEKWTVLAPRMPRSIHDDKGASPGAGPMLYKTRTPARSQPKCLLVLVCAEKVETPMVRTNLNFFWNRVQSAAPLLNPYHL